GGTEHAEPGPDARHVVAPHVGRRRGIALIGGVEAEDVRVVRDGRPAGARIGVVLFGPVEGVQAHRLLTASPALPEYDPHHHRILELRRHHRAGREAYFIAPCGRDDTAPRTGADGSADECAFLAAGDGADHRAGAGADADFLRVLFLRGRRL